MKGSGWRAASSNGRHGFHNAELSQPRRESDLLKFVGYKCLSIRLLTEDSLMAITSIQNARGVHQGLAISLLGLYALLPMLVLLVWLTREPNALIGWVVAIGALYLPLPLVVVVWICAVRAQLGLSQPMRFKRRPQVVLCVSGCLGLVQIAAITGALCWAVWASSTDLLVPATIITAVSVGFMVWSTLSFVRTLRWVHACTQPIAA